MSGAVPDTEDARADLAASLAPALDAVRALAALRGAWPACWGNAPDRLAVHRVHFSRKRPPVVQYRAEAEGGAARMLLAEAVGRAAARDHAEVESRRIAKAGGPVGAVIALPAPGLAVRLPGGDAALPGLALLRDPARAAALLTGPGGPWPEGTTARIRLRTHRVARRAVLEIRGFGGAPTVFARLLPGKRGGGLAAFELHQRIAAALTAARVLTAPQPLLHDAALGAAFYGALPGGHPDPVAPGASVAVAATMTALDDLRALGPRDAERHDAAREIALLAEWGARIDRHLPMLSELRCAAFDAVAGALDRLPEASPEPCHRDFHEGQVMIADGCVGLLDFDTYRMADPGLDPGNLIAHLRLAELRGGRRLSAVMAAAQEGAGLPADRIAPWTRAALLRLGCLYAFTTKDVVHAPRLMRDALEGLAP